jgi:hypothetical protein
MALHDASQDDIHIPPAIGQEQPLSRDHQANALPIDPDPTAQAATNTAHADTVPPPGSSTTQPDPTALAELPAPPESSPADEMHQPDLLLDTPTGETLLSDQQSITKSTSAWEGTQEEELAYQQSTTESTSASGDVQEKEEPAAPPSTQTSQSPLPAQRGRLDRTAVLALCLALVLLLLGSGGLIYDLAYYRPNQVLLAVTATTNAQATGTTGNLQTQIASDGATSTAVAQATDQVYQNIYQSATGNTPFLTDSLNHQSGMDWDEFSDPGQDSCGFKDGSYHDREIAIHYFNPCGEDGKGFGNFALQVDMTILSGDDGGIMFRGHDGFFYYFEIDLAGDYSFNIYDYKKSNIAQRLDTGSTGYMQSGNTQANEITLIAEEHTFYIYVNQHFIERVTDNSYQSGWIGWVADSYQSPTDVAFSNLKIWLF